MLKVIIAIVLLLIFKFILDSYKQRIKVVNEGGMQKKYSTIVDWLLNSHQHAKIFNETTTSIMIGVSSGSGLVTFDLNQTYGTVTFLYNVNSIAGKPNLEFNFYEYEDQNKMIKKMENDIIANGMKNIWNIY